MSEGGAALMAVGSAVGEDRAQKAAEQAISSQLLDITIDGARGILFNVTGGPDMTLFEVNQAAAIIKETAHPDVNLIFGAVIDPNMSDEIRITVIATGFERAGTRHIVETPVSIKENQPVRKQEARSNHDPIRSYVNVGANSASSFTRSVMEVQPAHKDDDDIPSFIKRMMNNQ
jgi:cell division protein FtsZ